jgi:hypothetical protein
MRNDTKEFLKIVAENPDLPIFGMVDSDVVCDDGGRWLASFGKACVGEIATYNERFFDDDREGFKEEYYDVHDEELCERFQYDPSISEYAVKQGYCSAEQLAVNNEHEKALDKYLDEVAEKYFIKAILVYVNTPDELIRE